LGQRHVLQGQGQVKRQRQTQQTKEGKIKGQAEELYEEFAIKDYVSQVLA
jgi:hypothetical protein